MRGASLNTHVQQLLRLDLPRLQLHVQVSWASMGFLDKLEHLLHARHGRGRSRPSSDGVNESGYFATVRLCTSAQIAACERCSVKDVVIDSPAMAFFKGLRRAPPLAGTLSDCKMQGPPLGRNEDEATTCLAQG